MKKIIMPIACAILITLNSGCSIRESFQPLPPLFKSWEKKEATMEEVKLALLKCGYENPYTGFDPPKKLSINVRAKISRCMRDGGYKYLLGGGLITCDHAEWGSLPECK